MPISRRHCRPILDEAQKASSQGRLTYLFNPSLSPDEEVNAYLNLRTPEDFGHADIVRFDAKTGALAPLRNSVGTVGACAVVRTWRLTRHSHGIGLMMYWNRYQRFRWRKLSVSHSIRSHYKDLIHPLV